MNGLLQRAKESGRPLQIIYESKNGRLSQRTVSIFRIRETDILVWCHHKQHLRTLKRSRILSAGPKASA
ncbi:WYL domain-containing protein [Salibacterium aidingense]|uniref:WYL domain-containing protein n=1 Tax=Salibacterium aidingense TaxID=384933 RepID=UPI0004078857|nr:hypothetical protein [Salibacterium aidingense]